MFHWSIKKFFHSVTVAVITATGIIGSIIGPFIFKILNIKDKVAIGIALGTASHAVGTSKAIELGEIEGAMGGLSIGITGLTNILIISIITRIFYSII